jgi:small subunit ribosomal protein S16
MLTIRLQRAGKKNKADFRIVLAEKTAASQKKFTEVLGSYNPHTKALVIRDQERLNYWVNEQHVEISATVNNLLVSKELIKGDKKKSFTIPKKEVVAEEAPAETPAEPAADAGEAAPGEAPAAEEAPAEVAAETPAEPEAPAEEPKEEAQV